MKTATDKRTGTVYPDMPDIQAIIAGNANMQQLARDYGVKRHCTDLGNSERFGDRFSRGVKYDHTLNAFRWYTGNHWAVDNGGVILHLAGIVARSIYTEAGNADDKKERRELSAWAQQSESRHRITAMLELAKGLPELSTEATSYDRFPDRLNVKNGVVNLRTGELSPHDPRQLHSKLAPVDFDPTLLERDSDGVPRYVEAGPTWARFLYDITLGRRDLILYLQRVFGYGATGDAAGQVLIVFYGHGDNGKTVVMGVIRHVLGDYFQAAPPSLIIDTGKGGGASPEVARLHGVRLVEIEETGDGDHLHESKVKWLTGSDRLVARHLYGDYFEFDPQFTPILITNHRPRVKSNGHAIWRRLRLVPFDFRVPAEKKDPHLQDKLKAEAPAILAWIVEGAKAYYRHGFPQSDTVDTATAGYRDDEDMLGPFLSERTKDEGTVNRTHLYQAYKEWTEREGEYPMSPRRFNGQLRERGYIEVAKRVYGGLSLLGGS